LEAQPVENKTRPDGMTLHCGGVAAVILKKDHSGHRVLLVKRAGSYAGAWCYVAGKLEPGEKVWQAALREIREETGLVPSALYTADIFEQFYVQDQETIWVAPVFVGYVLDRQKVVLNEEHSDFRWFTMEGARQSVAFPGQRLILEHVENEFIRRQPCHWLKIDAAAGPAKREGETGNVQDNI
jgi:dihydroneopterin triphosphate diphosphatase